MYCITDTVHRRCARRRLFYIFCLNSMLSNKILKTPNTTYDTSETHKTLEHMEIISAAAMVKLPSHGTFLDAIPQRTVTTRLVTSVIVVGISVNSRMGR